MSGWRAILGAMREGRLEGTQRLARPLSYLVAVLAALAAGFARYALSPIWGAKVPFITFYPAVVLAAWFGGLGPGLLATATSVAAALLFLAPVGALRVDDPNELVELALFTLINVLIAVLNEALHRARRRAEVTRDAARQSEERLRGIITSATDAIITIDAHQRITLFSAGAEAIFEYSAAEMIGRPLDRLLPERFREIHRQHIDTFGVTGVSMRAMGGERVLAGLRRSGEEFPIEARISQVEVGGQKLYAVILRDITERQRATEELQASRAALREQIDIVETINRAGQALSMELDLEKVVQAVTDAATSLTRAKFGAFFYNRIDERGEAYLLYTLSGAPREAFAGFPMPRNTAVFEPTFRGEGVVRLADVTKDRRYGKNPPYYGKPPGHLPVTSYLAVPVVSRSGEVLGGLFFGHSDPGVFTERDERIVLGLAAQAAIAIDNARLYEAERRARADAEAANRAKDEFLSVVSHELRTPLASMLGWVRVLRTDKGERTGRALDTLERNVQVQRKLIEDLVDVSRMATGRLRLYAGPLDLVPVIRTAIDAMRLEADAKQIRLDAVLAPLPGPVVGDPERLAQIALNLLSNAVKFTPAGGRVEVRLEASDSQARLVVQDTGEGISADFLPHVFERFRQAERVTERGRERGGLGLGLAITRHLVELHGGTIQAESDGEDQGAVFTVTLPLAERKSAS